MGLPNRDYSLVPSSQGVMVGLLELGSSPSLGHAHAPMDVLVDSPSNFVVGSGWLMPLLGDQVCVWDTMTLVVSSLAWENKYGLGWESSP